MGYKTSISHLTSLSSPTKRPSEAFWFYLMSFSIWLLKVLFRGYICLQWIVGDVGVLSGSHDLHQKHITTDNIGSEQGAVSLILVKDILAHVLLPNTSEETSDITWTVPNTSLYSLSPPITSADRLSFLLSLPLSISSECTARNWPYFLGDLQHESGVK